MECIIRKLEIQEVEYANSFLTKLIKDEKKYDENINDKCVVKECYENMIDVDTNCILVAVCDSKIVGYLYGFIMDTGDAYIFNTAKLEAMYVDGTYRLNNIGFSLIEAFKKWCVAKNVKYIELSVCVGNDAAKKLYLKNDFTVTKEIMTLKLGEENETI